MFRNTYQKGFLSVFYSIGSAPLAIWRTCVCNGHCKRLTDDDLRSVALEIAGVNVATTYITTPIDPRASLAIKLPFLVLIVKNMRKFFSFEVQILDDSNQLRRFRVSNYQSATKVQPFCTTMPLGLSDGWNQIQFNLADFTRRAYRTNYVETVRIQVHANVRIRRIYFSDRLYADEEKPVEYRMFVPSCCGDTAQGRGKGKSAANKRMDGKNKPPPVTPADSPRAMAAASGAAGTPGSGVMGAPATGAMDPGQCCMAPCAMVQNC